MKKGSGNLDFGQADTATEPKPDSDSGSEADSGPTETSSGESTMDRSSRELLDEGAADPSTPTTDPKSSEQEFPYFVRRSNVGDERDVRLEIHARPEVARAESTFRNELSDALETDEVAKTDAREFALKLAFDNPDAVAELMRDEGYGLVD